ncbi:hypothetical protein VTN77DRAFT_4361 [Rasamsonia byssochlamydoides]|uniref:uncharacterized protein n=1 Tax=Rasamsonia byssochlamydoides TaxID=89139 RepID=UPI0037438F38
MTSTSKTSAADTTTSEPLPSATAVQQSSSESKESGSHGDASNSAATTPNEPGSGGADAANISKHEGKLPEKVAVAGTSPGAGTGAQVELDEFGLPIRVKKGRTRPDSGSTDSSKVFRKAQEGTAVGKPDLNGNQERSDREKEPSASQQGQEGGHTSSQRNEDGTTQPNVEVREVNPAKESADTSISNDTNRSLTGEHGAGTAEIKTQKLNDDSTNTKDRDEDQPADSNAQSKKEDDEQDSQAKRRSHAKRDSAGISEWSHQRLITAQHSDDDDDEETESEGEWKPMPALGEMDYYDDYGRLVARGSKPEDDDAVYAGLGGSGKGYTRIRLDEDAQSVASMDEDTSYLFKDTHVNSAGVDDEVRDRTSQLQATKDLLTEGQRIAYVGVVRLAIYQMTKELQDIQPTKASKKALQDAVDSMKKWGQAIMFRLFTHMDIDSAEQIMIEQLAEHGVQPVDLVRPLMQNARVKNPMAEERRNSVKSTTSVASGLKEASRKSLSPASISSSRPSSPPPYEEQKPPPPYEGNKNGDGDVPEVQTPSQMPKSENIDIDLRWTVLCDLFLVLISDSSYDSRSRCLLERVGQAMDVSWVQICRFEKRVIDALEMEQQADKETWDEAANMEQRRKMALKKKFMIMGLATVGGGLVIGLSAGLLAPVIGAGLAAGFTTIGVTGTGAFLGGAGGTALIASGATLTGGITGLKASNRRTGAVKTFEYRPLHNNKRVNLIVTVSGWMNGKIDDVRLPYSTIDPIMGDLYSVFWEPEMLQSMGETINILATEALTQGLQQVLGSTILTALMGALQLPIILSKLSYLIDNPWNVSLVRANAAGLILADSIMDRNLGKRPITLLGFSLGSRVIFSCLKELAKKGAHGLVQNVYLFGSPIVANKDDYLKARSVVSGRFVNGYSSNDWILGYLFRATSGGIMRVAGLAPVEGIPGLENINVTNLVSGHMNYRAAIPRLLREVGWEVLSDEFAEIEDPDPDNHAERQRELIREIDEARREAEAKPDKKRFGLFKRSKLAQKKGWETYDPEQVERSSHRSKDSVSERDSVLFDIDAIRAELASEQIQVKQLESTLPPMKLELSGDQHSTATPANDTRPKLKQSKSADDAVSTNRHSIPTASENSHGRDADAPLPGEEDIQMTFDTSYHISPEDHYQYQHTYDNSASPPTRPTFYSSATAPAGLGSASVAAMQLEHNAWADHDIGHGEEGEIQLTFE